MDTSTMVVMGSRLQLRSARHLPKFLRGTMAIRRQLATTPGLVDYKLRAQMHRLTFWTLSSWENRDALNAFVRSGAHVDVMRGLRDADAMAAGEFAFWDAQVGTPLPTWGEVAERVRAAAANGAAAH